MDIISADPSGCFTQAGALSGMAEVAYTHKLLSLLSVLWRPNGTTLGESDGSLSKHGMHRKNTGLDGLTTK